MKLTPKQELAIRQLSDDALYHEAITFARQYHSEAQRCIANSQLQGLLQFSRSWTELDRFVQHQSSKDQAYQSFYRDLDNRVKEIRRLAQDKFVPEGLTKKETREQTDFFAGLLAREFIQHLVAEMLYLHRGKEKLS